MNDCNLELFLFKIMVESDFFPLFLSVILMTVFSEMDDTEVIPPEYLIKRFLERWRVGLRPDRRHGDHN